VPSLCESVQSPSARPVPPGVLCLAFQDSPLYAVLVVRSGVVQALCRVNFLSAILCFGRLFCSLWSFYGFVWCRCLMMSIMCVPPLLALAVAISLPREPRTFHLRRVSRGATRRRSREGFCLPCARSPVSWGIAGAG
jgi:hypothetical protein